MIRLEHVNMVVKDMPTTLAFYEVAFPHWKIRTQGRDDWFGTTRTWVHFGDEFNYLTFNDQGQAEPRKLRSNNMGVAHLGFEVANLAALQQRMEQAGFTPSYQGQHSAFRKNLYYIDPNGLEIEFVEYMSDLPAQRNH